MPQHGVSCGAVGFFTYQNCSVKKKKKGWETLICYKSDMLHGLPG